MNAAATKSASSQTHRARIDPVPPDIGRPLWSVMIPTFHCAGQLRETLMSVLSQDPGSAAMEIEVVDDHSADDDPGAVVSHIAGDRVGFFRQPKNVGHVANFATCIQRSRGHLVHLLHGDDLVRPGFYQKMEMAFEREPSVGAAFCRHSYIDHTGVEQSVAPPLQAASGILQNHLERLAGEQKIMTPSIVVRREVYEQLGGFDDRLVCAEDWEMWMRIAARHPIWYEVEPLAAYRMHLHSNTGRHIRSGEDILYTCAAIDMFSEYLPKEVAARVIPRAKRTYALSALRTARSLIATGDREGAKNQILAALGCSKSPRVWAALLALSPRAIAAAGKGRRAEPGKVGDAAG